MAAVSTTTLSGQYQKHFSKKLLSYAVQALVLHQWGTKAPLPRKAGSKQVSWFRFDEPSTSGIQTLTEGTPISSGNYRNLTLTEVTKALAQYGQVVELTDILTATDFYDSLSQAVKINGQDAALHFDTLVRNELATGTTKRYGQGLADFTALSAATQANGKIVATDLLDSVTQLHINRAPKINGYYAAVMCPQVMRDIQNDSDWLEAKKYSDVRDLYRGEVGMLHGAKVVMSTNPWVEDETEDTFDNVDDNSDGLIYATFVLGGEAYGCTELSGQSPYAPSIHITDKADKSDPLNQKTDIGFKSFWATKILNNNYFEVLRTKSTFA